MSQLCWNAVAEGHRRPAARAEPKLGVVAINARGAHALLGLSFLALVVEHVVTLRATRAAHATCSPGAWWAEA